MRPAIALPDVPKMFRCRLPTTYSRLQPEFDIWHVTSTSHSCDNEAGVSEAVPIDAMKTQKGSRGTAPFILILSSRWTWVAKLHDQAAFPRFLLNRRLDGPQSWSPGLISTGTWTPDRPARSPIAIPTVLLRLAVLYLQISKDNIKGDIMETRLDVFLTVHHELTIH